MLNDEISYSMLLFVCENTTLITCGCQIKILQKRWKKKQEKKKTDF